ncbi:alpha/beta hydrolase [Streptomyces sp. G-G2]|uniref:alpha/beta fold hydrolase n=1 Tax=Streptomyces sp. G-G2 TaxID=3046201 RepID=UPI0024BB365A|nr:alpha/beta hydrolase [Streptomyces sp. G-G2]MDJ0380533.1 alpha/beta hydrolase [Streptomyces sp. G-G2]
MTATDGLHPQSHTLRVPGALLHYEVRGAGPLLLLLGAPMDASAFGGPAEVLAADHTVVTLDPRGISGSVLDDPGQDSTPELRADDVAAVLDALGAESADVFGSSGGAVTGLALVARHPGRVRTLVAHEPPLLELLPDAAERRADAEAVVEVFRREGVGAAWARFMATIDTAPGAPATSADAPPQATRQAPAATPADTGPDRDAEAPFEPSPQDLLNSARFFGHELHGTVTHQPDFRALAAGTSRIVVGVGADSRGQTAHRTALALADRLGSAPAVEFPGDHAGFLAHPKEFADRLRETL